MGKQYKDLSINGKINAKSWGFWRLPNTKGFVMTMIDNTKSFNDADGKPRTDYADFMRHTLIEEYTAEAPKANVIQKGHIHNIYGDRPGAEYNDGSQGLPSVRMGIRSVYDR